MKQFDIIAIQEPWLNAYTNTTHNPLKSSHNLIYSDPKQVKKTKVRMCMFISRRIPITDCEYTFRSGDVVTTKIKLISNETENHYLHVHNVYNELDTLPCPALAAVKNVLEIQTPNGSDEHILIEDFNIHHPSWENIGARADNRFQELLSLMDEYQLTFNLSMGTSTYFHFQESESTIDLCLITPNLTERVLQCKTDEKLNHNSNHLLITTTLDIVITSTPPSQKYN